MDDKLKEYLKDIYKIFTNEHLFTTLDMKILALGLTKEIIDMEASMNGTSVTVNNKVFNLIKPVNESRIGAIDFNQVNNYYQIHNKENNKFIRMFLSPMDDKNIFLGYYEDNSKPTAKKPKPEAVLEVVASTNIIANSTFISNMISFLNGNEISNIVEGNKLLH
jgi:hypothetical protein